MGPMTRNATGALARLEGARKEKSENATKHKELESIVQEEEEEDWDNHEDPEEARQQLRCSFEYASVLQFLDMFRSFLELGNEYSAEKLDNALIYCRKEVDKVLRKYLSILVAEFSCFGKVAY